MIPWHLCLSVRGGVVVVVISHLTPPPPHPPKFKSYIYWHLCLSVRGGVVGGSIKNREKFLQSQNWMLSTRCRLCRHNYPPDWTDFLDLAIENVWSIHDRFLHSYWVMDLESCFVPFLNISKESRTAELKIVCTVAPTADLGRFSQSVYDLRIFVWHPGPTTLAWNLVAWAQVLVANIRIFIKILNEVVNFWEAKLGYQQPKSGSPSKFQVA